MSVKEFESSTVHNLFKVIFFVLSLSLILSHICLIHISFILAMTKFMAASRQAYEFD